MKCDAKIRPFPGDTEVECDYTAPSLIGHTEHEGVVKDYAYPGSRTTLHWNEHDRRTFRGEWAPCDKTEGCICPRAHPGNCAV